MKLREWLKSQSRISCCLILIKRAYLSDLDQIIKSYFLSCSVQESGLSFMIGFVIEIVVSEKIYQDSRADSNCQIYQFLRAAGIDSDRLWEWFLICCRNAVGLDAYAL